MKNTQQYVLGFAFDVHNDDVVLIKKKRPTWQQGLLNGVGGKVGDNILGEVPIEAMVREFKEETGYATDPSYWKKMAELSDDNETFVVHVYATYLDTKSVKSASMHIDKKIEDEEVVIINRHRVNRFNSIRNLEFLLPMAKLVLDTDHPQLEIKEIA